MYYVYIHVLCLYTCIYSHCGLKLLIDTLVRQQNILITMVTKWLDILDGLKAYGDLYSFAYVIITSVEKGC